MHKKRGGLAKIGLLAIALMISLGAMGLVYSGWTDVVNVNGTVNVAYEDPVVNCGFGSPQVACSVDATNPMKLNLGVNASAATTYTRNFSIQNTGELPEKIKGITKDLSGVPAGVTVFVTNVVGTTIDPGQTKNGTISVNINGSVTLPASFSFTVTFTAGPWNMP